MRTIMLLPAAALVAAFLLASCATNGVSTDKALASVCATYAETLSVLADYKARMSAAQVRAVGTSWRIVSPICRAGAAGLLSDPEAGLATVREQALTLLTIEKEFAP